MKRMCYGCAAIPGEEVLVSVNGHRLSIRNWKGAYVNNCLGRWPLQSYCGVAAAFPDREVPMIS